MYWPSRFFTVSPTSPTMHARPVMAQPLCFLFDGDWTRAVQDGGGRGWWISCRKPRLAGGAVGAVVIAGTEYPLPPCYPANYAPSVFALHPAPLHRPRPVSHSPPSSLCNLPLLPHLSAVYPLPPISPLYLFFPLLRTSFSHTACNVHHLAHILLSTALAHNVQVHTHARTHMHTHPCTHTHTHTRNVRATHRCIRVLLLRLLMSCRSLLSCSLGFVVTTLIQEITRQRSCKPPFPPKLPCTYMRAHPRITLYDMIHAPARIRSAPRQWLNSLTRSLMSLIQRFTHGFTCSMK